MFLSNDIPLIEPLNNSGCSITWFWENIVSMGKEANAILR